MHSLMIDRNGSPDLCEVWPHKPAPQVIEKRMVPRLYQPSHDEIARLAQLLWEARGGVDGFAEEDWYTAERALRGAYGPLAVAALVNLGKKHAA
jgi:hypothetical protein